MPTATHTDPLRDDQLSASARRAAPVTLRSLGRFWTAANVLSLLRLVATLPLAYLIAVQGSAAWIWGLLLFAVMTDYFDGKVARWSGTVSDWGKVLDPIADKIGGGLVLLACALKPDEPRIPLWFPLALFVRDAVLVGGAYLLGKRAGHVVMSVWTGKVASAALALIVFAVILRADPPVLDGLVWFTVALLAYATLVYIVRFARLMRSRRPPPPDPAAEPISPPRARA